MLVLEIFSNLIKLDDKLRLKFRDKFEKKTQKSIYEITNHSIWIYICEEINEQSRRKNFAHEARENDKN